MESVTFNKVADFQPATLLKVTLLDGCFSRFLNCANGTRSRKTSQMVLHCYDLGREIQIKLRKYTCSVINFSLLHVRSKKSYGDLKFCSKSEIN